MSGQRLSDEELAALIARLDPDQKEFLSHIVRTKLAEQKADEAAKAHEAVRPTADDLAHIKEDTRLAVYIVGVLTLRHSVYFDVSNAGSDEAHGLLWLIQDIRDAIRQGITEVDMVELEWLHKAKEVK